MVTLLNVGDRTYHLHDAVRRDGKLIRRPRKEDNTFEELKAGDEIVRRALGPNEIIEALDDQEAKDLLAYRDIKDASTVKGSAADVVKELTGQRDALAAEVADLKAKLVAYEPAEESKGKGKGKGKGD